jgi:hypothetical protein
MNLMQDRLNLCLDYLKEVESKLIELQRTPYSDARMAEALSFVQQAINAVRQTHHFVERLPAAVTHIEQHPLKTGSAT